MTEYVSLAQARLTAGDDVDRTVIDEFVKSSELMSRIGYHRAATAEGGVWAYTYTKQTSQPTAAFRALNADYTKSVVTVDQVTAVCSVLGGNFGIDRVLAANPTQVALQMAQKVKGTQAAFADACINGDSAGESNQFDGLSVALTGSDTEVDGSSYDWTNSSGTQAAAFSILENLDDLLAEVDGSEGLCILGNKQSVARIRNAARLAGYKTASEDAAGRVINTYAGVPIIDLGAKAGSNDQVIPTTAGLSDVYVVRFALDGFHAVTPAGQNLINTRLPNPDSDSPVLVGWVEMTAAVALKQTRAAAVLRDVQVAAISEGS